VALACTAGVSKNFVYRGSYSQYSPAHLWKLPFAAFFALVVSSAWFAMAHLYQGRRGVYNYIHSGILFSTVRILDRDIVPAIVWPYRVDLVAGLYAPRALRTRPDLR